MAIHQRKELLSSRVNSYYPVVRVECNSDYTDDCLLPPPPPSGDQSKSNLPISPLLLLLFCFLAGVFFIVCYLIVLKKNRLNFNTFRRTNSISPNFDPTDEDFVNEDHGPEVIHPIWFINTVGLQQSVIDSISVFKYKKDDVLIEGTDCSVCLSEFQEDENLRLLPKCSHAFHIQCIDTWLRSHKNCPLCRAPVASDTTITTTNVNESTGERNLNELNTTEDNLVENSANNDELGSRQVGENRDETSETGDENEDNGTLALPVSIEDDNMDKSWRFRNCNARVYSDLVDRSSKEEGELQVRRSVSMDISSASMIYLPVANIHPTDSRKISKQSSRSSSRIFGVMKSYSFRRFSEKRPISMKRAFSSGGKYYKGRSSTSQDSILPL